MRVRYLFGALALALALGGAGCSDKKIKVKGVVTLDGSPVDGALVTFVPDGGAGQNAIGVTQQGGAFQLTTSKTNDGVEPGNYKVTVTYGEGVETAPQGGMRDAMQSVNKAQRQRKPPPKYVIPPRYSDPGKTPLKQKVPPDGEVKIEITSK
jgi:hypothetical protein